jgi:hypothetical protein
MDDNCAKHDTNANELTTTQSNSNRILRPQIKPITHSLPRPHLPHLPHKRRIKRIHILTVNTLLARIPHTHTDTNHTTQKRRDSSHLHQILTRTPLLRTLLPKRKIILTILERTQQPALIHRGRRRNRG